MAASTLLQLLEVVVGAAFVLAGMITHSVPLGLVGGGFLIGLAIAAILAPEGGTIYRRSLVGYAVASLFVLGGLVVNHLHP